ncbi:MAG: hypothetical protein HDR32_12460 [Treponema sp.]|nr:hypothetical protein [Treponema sp.]MBD5448511.1 hypothetical protein [Treponema sp.]
MEQDIVERTQEQDGAERAQTVRVDIDGLGEYTYFMTNDFSDVIKKLKNLGYRTPRPQDWRLNPDLHQNVRAKMAERGATYSLTMSHGAAVLNNYVPEYVPHIIYLSNLAKPQQTEAMRDSLTPAAQAEKEVMRVLTQKGANMSMQSKRAYYALMHAIVLVAKKTLRINKQVRAKLERVSPTPAIDKRKVPFTEKLAFYLQNSLQYSKNKSHAIIYKRGGISRQTFSKIIGEDSYYRPKKDTVFQLAIGMRLTIEQTKDLLESAGHHLLPDDAFDATVADFISRMDYDLRTIDEALFKKTNRTLCSYK